MNGQTDLTQLFFSSSGRLARAPFVVAVAVLFGLFVVYDAVVGGWWFRWIIDLVVDTVLLFCAACVVSKRLHDRGKSGWWAALVLVAFARVYPFPHRFWDFLFVLVLAWAAVELALLPGEQGFNRFGPNPSRGSDALPAV